MTAPRVCPHCGCDLDAVEAAGKIGHLCTRVTPEPMTAPREPGFYWVRWPQMALRWTVVERLYSGELLVPGKADAVSADGAEWGPRIKPPPEGT